VPAAVYVWVGFWRVEVPPSPKDQTQEFGEFVEASTNWTVSGPYPEVVVALKRAVGAAVTWVMVM
jgi:hypothetical protein